MLSDDERHALLEKSHQMTRRAFAAMMATNGQSVPGNYLRESQEAWDEWVGAGETVRPPPVIKPMPPVTKPVASVMVLAHRRDPEGIALLGEATRSVQAQTLEGVQCVVQDAEAWWPDKINDGVKATSSPYVAILCYDDLLAPTFMAETVSVAEETGADIVYTDRLCFGMKPAFVLRSPRAVSPDYFQFDQPFPMTCLIRRTWWDQVGGYDGSLGLCDGDFWFRSIMAGAKVACQPGPLFHYREHAGQGSQTMDVLWHYDRCYEKWRSLGLIE